MCCGISPWLLGGCRMYGADGEERGVLAVGFLLLNNNATHMGMWARGNKL